MNKLKKSLKNNSLKLLNAGATKNSSTATASPKGTVRSCSNPNASTEENCKNLGGRWS